jgi:FKBP-type peptidyl-prolyl cis-trans isomerase 2
VALDATTDALIEYRSDLSCQHGGCDGAPAKVEQVLEGLKVDSHIEVTLSLEKGYGAHDPRLLMTLPAAGYAFRCTSAITGD